jgi:hypothetical protein
MESKLLKNTFSIRSLVEVKEILRRITLNLETEVGLSREFLQSELRL